MSEDAYASAGVSQRGADAAVEALVRSLKLIDTGKPSRVVPLPNHYASVLRVTDSLGVAFGTDGVGTKMLVAERMDDFTTIGIDCIAMNVNDLICVGAEPIAMLDFILCRSADPKTCGAIGAGLRRGAELAGIEIPGGEIAQVGDLVSGTELTGSAIGLVEPRLDRRRQRAQSPATRSSDFRPQAFTPTATRLRARSSSPRWTSTTTVSGARSARCCSSPPRSTFVPCSSCSAPRSRSAASPTSRATASTTSPGCAAPVGFEVSDPLDVPPVFDLIAELGGVPDEEMYEVFNMGCGFVCVVARRR